MEDRWPEGKLVVLGSTDSSQVNTFLFFLFFFFSFIPFTLSNRIVVGARYPVPVPVKGAVSSLVGGCEHTPTLHAFMHMLFLSFHSKLKLAGMQFCRL